MGNSNFEVKPNRQPRGRNSSISLSLTPEEKISIEEAAADLDCTTSEYIRAVHRAYCEYRAEQSQKQSSSEAK